VRAAPILPQKEIPLRIRQLMHAWWTVLAGRKPSLSIEITRECPLRCPGCYAYSGDRLGGLGQTGRVQDYRGKHLVDGVLRLVDRHRPIHVSLVGGEPLVRFRELSTLLPQLEDRGVHIQLVTSAVRPIPLEWREVRNLNLVVSVDGLQPEHDARRKPATYERILKNIEGHRITVHCTITRQMTDRADYLGEFVDLWSGKDEVRRIWMSLFTPQVGEVSSEMLPPESRESVIDTLFRLRREFPKLEMPEGVLEALRVPPRTPQSCLFASITQAVAADLERTIHPCQLGGNPECSQCGCMASAALAAMDRHRLLPGIRLGTIYNLSCRMGQRFRAVRQRREKGAGMAKVPAGLAELASD
jgi:MoaA/NifB/PqqE/SkfB family radical SAM enzyme